MKCLVVEDAAFIREIYFYSLRNTPYEIVDEAKDGEEAIEKIKKLQPEIIILDLVLPLKNGFDILKELTLLSPRSRVLVVSSLEGEDDIKRAKSLGAIEYLTKPFTKIQLLEALEIVSQLYSEVQNG